MIKRTRSLCPECYKPLDAVVFEENDKIMIKKTCPEHGEFINTYWGDAEAYHKMEQYPSTETYVENPQVSRDAGCPDNCGLCEQHQTTTVLGLLDVTNRCNLHCPVCFANAAVSKRLYEPTFEEIRGMLQTLRDVKPVPTPAIQFAGGEPTVRNDFPQIIKMAKDMGFTHVQVATNGLRLARKEGYAKELKDAGLNTVYLQFDGLTPEPYINNRGKDLLQQKLNAIEKCREADLGIVLVPTLVKGINDDQVGDIIDFAFDNNDIIYGVNFQPVAFAGRIDKDLVESQRITIPDFQKLVDEQTNGEIPVNAFYPPSSVEPITKFIYALDEKVDPVMLNCHHHCGSATYVYREKEEDGSTRYIPITNFLNVDGFLSFLDKSAEKLTSHRIAAKTRVAANAATKLYKYLEKDEKPKHLDFSKIFLEIFKDRNYNSLGKFSKNAMLIACMHFMDPYNFDEDRVQKCIIHYVVPDGRIIPFCTMNSRYRQGIEEEFSVPYTKEATKAALDLQNKQE